MTERIIEAFEQCLDYIEDPDLLDEINAILNDLYG